MADFAIRLLGKALARLLSTDATAKNGYVLWVNTTEPADRVVKAISISELKKLLNSVS